MNRFAAGRVWKKFAGLRSGFMEWVEFQGEIRGFFPGEN